VASDSRKKLSGSVVTSVLDAVTFHINDGDFYTLLGVGAWLGNPDHQTLPRRFHDLMHHLQ
jgi:hypothetical protein